MTDFSHRLSQSLAKLPPYLFARIDGLKEEALAKGVDLIDITVGDPDQPTFSNIVEKMQEATANPAYHRYPSYQGLGVFRQAVADWDVPYEVIDVPVLAVTGLQDHVFLEPADVAALCARIPDVERVDLSDAGHMIPAERPESLARAILDFAGRMRAGDTGA